MESKGLPYLRECEMGHGKANCGLDDACMYPAWLRESNPQLRRAGRGFLRGSTEHERTMQGLKRGGRGPPRQLRVAGGQLGPVEWFEAA